MNKLFCAAVFSVLVGCAKPIPEKAIPVVRIVKTDRLAEGTAARYSATVEPQTRVDLAFKVGGYAAKLAMRKGTGAALRTLQAGDDVTRGEVLAQLKATDYENQRSQAQAALSESTAALEKATLDYGRAKKLRLGEDITQADIDGARVAVDAAKARVDGAQARLSQANSALEDSTLRAPLAGTVVKRNIEVGTLVSPGAVAFSIEDTSTVKVVFGVPDGVVSRLKLGARHAVASDAVREKMFLGTLSRISPTADPKTRLFEAEVSISNEDGELKPGMVATLVLDKEVSATATLPTFVPLSAIVRAPTTPGAYAVFLIDERDGQTFVKSREVTLGEFMGNEMPVTSGLAVNERVVVSGASLLADGERVRVLQ